MKLMMTLLMMGLSFSSYGRAPAVDPFVGVEPSSYIDRAPSSEKPYNFEQAAPVQKVEIKTTSKAPITAPLLAKAESHKGEFNLPYFFIIAGLMTLPFGIWQMTVGKLSDKVETNVVTFPAKKDDDDDWKKKAS